MTTENRSPLVVLAALLEIEPLSQAQDRTASVGRLQAARAVAGASG